MRKRKRGRPVKAPKTERLHIRLPAKVKETIIREAEHEGRSISDYILRKLSIKSPCLHERWEWKHGNASPLDIGIRVCVDCRESLKPVMSGIVKKHIPFKNCGDPTCRQCNTDKEIREALARDRKALKRYRELIQPLLDEGLLT